MCESRRLTRRDGRVGSRQRFDATFHPSHNFTSAQLGLIPPDALGCRVLLSSTPCLRQQWRHSWADCSTCAAPSMWRPTSKLRHGTKAAHSSLLYALDVTLYPWFFLFQVFVTCLPRWLSTTYSEHNLLPALPTGPLSCDASH